MKPWFRHEHRPRSGEEAFDSNAEQDFFIYLQLNAPHLLTGLRTHEAVPLPNGEGSVPDFLWSSPQPTEIALYLDGEPHLGSHQQDKDQRITKAMEKDGWKVIRVPYRGRLSKTLMAETIKKVESMMMSAQRARAEASQTP